MGWILPLLVREESYTLTRKYNPRSDFEFRASNSFPYIIGEVVSKKSETDRARMLLQAAAAARVGRFLQVNGQKPFVLLAVYVTNELIAERYLVWAKNAVSFFLLGCSSG